MCNAGRVVTLKKNKEFSFVYRRGKPSGTKNILCLCAKSRFGGLRVGFVVSNKVGNAVVRNLWRRRLKEAWRLLLPELSGNFCVLLIARPGLADVSYAQAARELRSVLKKQGLLQPR